MLAAEGLITFGVAVWQAVGLAGGADRPEVALGSATYFLLVAVILAGMAVLTWRGSRWVYGPTVFVQVLALPVAGSMLVEGFWLGAAILGGLAVGGLLLLIPESGRAAFGRAEAQDGPPT